MRTIVDIPREAVEELDRITRRHGKSRAEVIREAVAEFLQRHRDDEKKSRTAFGGWRNRKIDGLTYQDALRREWTRCARL